MSPGLSLRCSPLTPWAHVALRHDGGVPNADLHAAAGEAPKVPADAMGRTAPRGDFDAENVNGNVSLAQVHTINARLIIKGCVDVLRQRRRCRCRWSKWHPRLHSIRSPAPGVLLHTAVVCACRAPAPKVSAKSRDEEARRRRTLPFHVHHDIFVLRRPRPVRAGFGRVRGLVARTGLTARYPGQRTIRSSSRHSRARPQNRARIGAPDDRLCLGS